MSEVKLTAKQEAFCREYLIDLNATQAAIRAGYSEKTATEQSSRLLTNVKVSEFIAELKTSRNESLRIDAAWVLRQAVRVHERCMQSEPVTDREGNPIGEYKFEHAGANKALEIIGKHVDVKAFEKEGQVIVSNNIMPVPCADSAEEWEQVAKTNQEKLLSNNDN